MSPWRRRACVVLVALVAAFGSAIEVPTDAEVFLTDEQSRIVGVGRVVAGERFELVLEEGYTGPALLVWLHADGKVRTVRVVVENGSVWVDGEELTTLLPGTFVEVGVRLAKRHDGAAPTGAGQGPPSDVPGEGPPDDRGPPETAGPLDGAPGAPNDPGPPDDGGPPVNAPPAVDPPVDAPPTDAPPVDTPPDGEPSD